MAIFLHTNKNHITNTKSINNTTKFVTVYEYEIDTKFNNSNLLITWTCPFVGNSNHSTVSLVNLKLDDEVLMRTGISSFSNSNQMPLTIQAFKNGVYEGVYKIVIEAKVSGGRLQIPHCEPNHLEGEDGIDVLLTIVEIERTEIDF